MSSLEFKEFNSNPKKRRTYDFNLNTLCAVSNFSWIQMYDKMSDIARDLYRNTEDAEVTVKILERWKFDKHSIKIEKGEKRPTVYDIANLCGNKYEYVVCRISGGFLPIVRGCLLSRDDLRYCKVYNYYTKDRFLNPYL